MSVIAELTQLHRRIEEQDKEIERLRDRNKALEAVAVEALDYWRLYHHEHDLHSLEIELAALKETQ